jgi:riboflavin kinase / FMN adenylyltransferase
LSKTLTQINLHFQSLIDPLTLPHELQGAILAIGNFDGVHRGHQAVLTQAKHMGQRLSRPVVLLNFEPHPREYFQPGLQIFRLSPPDVKAQLCERFGLNAMITLSFNADLAVKTADNFVSDVLVDRFHIRGAIVGFDFQYGAKRTGTAQSLQDAGKHFGFEVEITPEFRANETEISSTIIRQKLREGDVKTANALLGYDWFIMGEVVHGRKLGRALGYPTANIRLDDGCELKLGIYAVRLNVAGKTHDAVASFGRRPTFDNGAPLLEVFVFDFNADLYGKTVSVSFVNFIRAEAKFDGIETLIEQMNKDSGEAKRMLNNI